MNYRVNVVFNLEPFKKDSTERAFKRLIRLGAFIVRNAIKLCPVDTGRLRSSLSWTWTGKGSPETSHDSTAAAFNKRAVGLTKKGTDRSKNLAEASDYVSEPGTPLTVRVGTNVFYAPDVEFGTLHQQAQPYLRPAIATGEAQWDADRMGSEADA